MSRRSTAALALAAFGLAVSSTPAVAAPVYDDAGTYLQGNSGFVASGASCTTDPSPPVSYPYLPVAENGAPTTLTSQASGSAHGAAPTDNVTGSASATVTGRVSSAAGLPRTLDMSVSGQAAVSSQQPTSDCSPLVVAGGELALRFTLTQPVWLHLDVSSHPRVFNDISLNRTDDNTYYVNVNNRGVRLEREYRYLLPAGSYEGSVYARVELQGIQTPSVSGASTVHGTFAVPGSLTTPASGKGLRYVTLPTSATCAGHSLDPAVTTKGKRAGQIKQVAFFLGEVRVAKVKHPKKGKVVSLPVAAGAPTSLRAEVTLEPKAKGKKPKTVGATASYEACA